MKSFAKGPMSQEEFKTRLFSFQDRYHIHHPYQVAMSVGKLTKAQIQAWVANRYYYQIMIPRKDAAILSNCEDRQVRRNWIQRILDHDGFGDDPGGIEAWLRLGEACGLKREEIESLEHVLPGVRFAVDAYYHFAKEAPWQEAVCSSLTELFAPKIHQQRLDYFPKLYPWVHQEGLTYFQKRLSQARRDVEFGLDFVLNHFSTYELQQRALHILDFKINVLWSLLDALLVNYPLES
mgnify:CR=1 FL=1